ncbi:MAG: S-layer homology domain-containing protein, partial [Peptoniphilus harei]|nr:S-layer homology domain-containing protein [Peptoniphilus harei]
KALKKYYESKLEVTNKHTFESEVAAADATYAEKKAAKEEAQKYVDEVYTPAKNEVTKLTPVLTDASSKEDVKAAKEKLAKAEEKLAKVKDSEAKDDLLATVKAYKDGIKKAEDKLAADERQKAYNEYYTAIQTKLATVEYKDSSVIADKEANIKAAVKAALDTVEGKGTYEIASVDVSTGEVTVKVKPLYTGVTAKADLTQKPTAK